MHARAQQRWIFVPKNIFAACCGAYRGSELTPLKRLKYLANVKEKSSKPGTSTNLFSSDKGNGNRIQAAGKADRKERLSFDGGSCP